MTVLKIKKPSKQQCLLTSVCIISLFFLFGGTTRSDSGTNEHSFIVNSKDIAPVVNISEFTWQRITIAIVTVIGNDRNKNDKINADDTIIKTVKDFPLFHDLIPSFCATYSVGFHYKFFLAINTKDTILSASSGRLFIHRIFNETINEFCNNQSHPTMRLIETHASKRLDIASTVAYHEGADFIYLVHETTKFLSPKWSETFIKTLQQFHPPHIGVVGPYNVYDNQSNNYLTNMFVHYTHFDIFGYFHPHNLNAIDKVYWWIKEIYSPYRAVCVVDFKVRYISQRTPTDALILDKDLQKQISADKQIIKEWIYHYRKARAGKS